VGVGAGGQPVGQEEQVEAALLRRARDALDEAQVLTDELCLGVAPAGDVVAGALQEQAEAHRADESRGHPAWHLRNEAFT